MKLTDEVQWWIRWTANTVLSSHKKHITKPEVTIFLNRKYGQMNLHHIQISMTFVISICNFSHWTLFYMICKQNTFWRSQLITLAFERWQPFSIPFSFLKKCNPQRFWQIKKLFSPLRCRGPIVLVNLFKSGA